MSASIYAGNLQRTGEYQTRGVRTPPTIRWIFSTQGHICFPPLVAHDRVYVGGNDEYFYALGIHTGVLQWRFETDGVRQGAQSDHGITSVNLTETTTYFATETGIIYGVDLHTGQETWRFDTSTMEQNGEEEDEEHDPAISSSVIVDDLLLFRQDRVLCAIKLATKELLWSEEVGGAFGEDPTACPTICDQMLYHTVTVYHNGATALTAYHVGKQEVVWVESPEYNDSMFYGYTNSVEGVVPVVDGTAYFAGSSENTCGLIAADAATGKLQWAYERSSDPGPWEEGAYTAVAGDLVYLVSERGDVEAVERSTHQARWTRQSEQPRGPWGKSYAPPSLADGVLYLAREDGLITALDA